MTATGDSPPEPSPEDLKLAQQMAPYLLETGWIESRRLRRSVDRDQRPIPWLTYPAIDFLAERVTGGMSVFEFGSGYSTLWWAERAARVTCVEHNPDWAEEVRSMMPPNVDFNHVALEPDGDYCHMARAKRKSFDVIVVDGRDRVNCALRSVDSLSPDGVIVWDNSDRRRYAAGVAALRKRGFRQLKFRGPTPIDTWVAETSVFYRARNCLGL